MMEFGFCELAVAPVRREPSDMAEMSSQLMFGDLVEIPCREDSWCQVKILYDGYEGWVDVKQVRIISEQEFRRLGALPVSVNRQLYSDVIFCDDLQLHLPAGCSFYNLAGQVMVADDKNYRLEGNAYPFTYSGLNGLLETAAGYFFCPYLWGGKTYLGLDCSGFTQVVYKQHGIKLLRDAAQQATQGELISILNDGKPGDLAFFDDVEGRIVHVGILMENQKIIHCSGRVRIDEIDHQGIFNRESNRYTHRLRLLRRVIAS